MKIKFMSFSKGGNPKNKQNKLKASKPIEVDKFEDLQLEYTDFDDFKKAMIEGKPFVLKPFK